MANDSILMRTEVEEIDDDANSCIDRLKVVNTITQAVELLERMANLYPYHIEFVNDPNCCEQCNEKMAAQQWLARYHAAASSPQPEPSPPQK